MSESSDPAELEALYEALEEAQGNDQVASACFIYENILTIEETENIGATLLYVTDLIDLGNIGQAEATLVRIEELCEDNEAGDLCMWHSVSADLHAHVGRYEEAIAAYRKAHELDTSRGDLLALAANAAFQTGEAGKAEYLIREALKFPCEQSEVQAALGTYLAAQRRFQEATDAFKKALSLDAENTFAAEWIEDLEQLV